MREGLADEVGLCCWSQLYHMEGVVCFGGVCTNGGDWFVLMEEGVVCSEGGLY